MPRAPTILISRQFGLDDHRDAHLARIDADFARSIVSAMREALVETKSQRVVLCESPRMLGTLRPLVAPIASGGVAIVEVARDLVKLTPARLRVHLASLGALPPVKRWPRRSTRAASRA